MVPEIENLTEKELYFNDTIAKLQMKLYQILF